MSFVIVLAVLFVVVIVVTAPLRTARRPEAAGSAMAELEAAREAKYREIRDAELDHLTGKLSDADYEALDAGLRVEALEILRSIDHLRESPRSASPASAA